MFVYIAGYLLRPRLLLFHELIIHRVELRILLEQRHELVVRTVALQCLVVFVIQRVGIVDELRQLTQAP